MSRPPSPPDPALDRSALVLRVLRDSPTMVIYDTEFTANDTSLGCNWSGPGDLREIFQIGAVKLETARFTLVDTFQALVRPTFQPHISAYVQALTGVSREAVLAAPPLAPVLDAFWSFCDHGNATRWSKGNDWPVIDLDLRLSRQSLPAHCVFHSAPQCLELALQMLGLDTGQHVSGTLHEALGLALPGRAHDALHDALSLARTLQEMLRRQGTGLHSPRQQ